MVTELSLEENLNAILHYLMMASKSFGTFFAKDGNSR